jgi:hypothetical protein
MASESNLMALTRREFGKWVGAARVPIVPGCFDTFFDSFFWLEKNCAGFLNWDEMTRYIATIDLVDGMCHHPLVARRGVLSAQTGLPADHLSWCEVCGGQFNREKPESFAPKMIERWRRRLELEKYLRGLTTE